MEGLLVHAVRALNGDVDEGDGGIDNLHCGGLELGEGGRRDPGLGEHVGRVERRRDPLRDQLVVVLPLVDTRRRPRWWPDDHWLSSEPPLVDTRRRPGWWHDGHWLSSEPLALLPPAPMCFGAKEADPDGGEHLGKSLML